MRRIVLLLLLAALAGEALFLGWLLRRPGLPASPVPPAPSASPSASQGIPRAREVAPEVSTPEPLRADVSAERGAGAVLSVAGVIRWTNVQRGRAGLEPLQEDPALAKAARAKLTDMFARQYFAHDDPDGQGIAAVVKRLGYAYLRVGENLALGNFPGDEALVNAWMDSPGHRANILQPKYAEIGVAAGRGTFQGKETWLAVQAFALPTSACPQADGALLQEADSAEEEQEKLAAAIEEARSALEQRRAARDSVVAEIRRLTEEGNAKIAEGNAEIEEGNRVLLETNDRSAAEPHWQRGEQLQVEGRKKYLEARAKTAELEMLDQEIARMATEVDQKIEAFNERQGEFRALIERLNAQIRARNACAGG